MSAELQVIPARHGTATFVPRGSIIKIINTSGTQVIDTWAFALHNPPEKLAPKEKEPKEKKEKKERKEQPPIEKQADDKKEATNKKAADDTKSEAKEPDKKSDEKEPDKKSTEEKSNEGKSKNDEASGEAAGEEKASGGTAAKGWTSYLPSLRSKGDKGDKGDKSDKGETAGNKAADGKAAESKAAEDKKSSDEAAASKGWSAYMPSGIGFTSYLPSKGALSAFAASHYRDPNKSYVEQLQDFSKTPVGAAGLSGIALAIDRYQYSREQQRLLEQSSPSEKSSPRKLPSSSRNKPSRTQSSRAKSSVVRSSRVKPSVQDALLTIVQTAATGSGPAGSLYSAYSAYNAQHAAENPAMEYMSMPHCRAHTEHLVPKVNDTLVSNLREPLLTLVEDTSPGIHDTLIAACDPQRYKGLGVEKWEEHGSCAENLVFALKELNDRAGLKGAKAVGADVTVNMVPAPLNLFMNIPWTDKGDVKFESPAGKKGDYVRLKAERDVVVVMSACPQDVLTINAKKPTDGHFVVELDEEGQASASAQREKMKKVDEELRQADKLNMAGEALRKAEAKEKKAPKKLEQKSKDKSADAKKETESKLKESESKPKEAETKTKDAEAKPKAAEPKVKEPEPKAEEADAKSKDTTPNANDADPKPEAKPAPEKKKPKKLEKRSATPAKKD
ncbi:hypothetical protein B0A49_07336 [Cryomyces minteri]|uniref:DUF1989 domain-containing protein n=2 Tax=Cryomyces minteri TaxID=331657 RepID=A0A4U0X1E2_9PEZI|nr:hypothetical protein B0A49_07336 [Cryomyces minteri]